MMPVRRALPFIYRRSVRGKDAEERLEIDALLGDETAKAELQSRRRDVIAMMDAEFG